MRKLPLLLRALRRRPRKDRLSARYDVRREAALPVPAADGVILRTDHYAPVTAEPCPTVLIRAPYVRSGFPFNYLYGVLVAEQGFHVILQSSRGTGGSEGVYRWVRDEAADGQATVRWLRDQPWFTGDLYTLGASYMAYTQAVLAHDPPPEWRGAVLQVGFNDTHRFFWGGGVFHLERALIGGALLFLDNARTRDYFRGTLRLMRNLKRITHDVPLLDAYQRGLGGHRPVFEEWLAHPEAEHWADTDVAGLVTKLPVPVSLCTGWWDLEPAQIIEQYTGLRAAGADVDLLIGPWTHTSALDKGWTETFPQALRRLRGEPAAYRVRVHVGGVDEWRDLPDWPPPQATRDLSLAEDLSAGPGASTFHYDPADPTPSYAGALQSPTQGQRDNAPLEKRADVLLFTSEPLTAPLEIMGSVRATFDATTTAASGDVFARLCDVDPSGRSINICDGLTRMSGGRTVVELGPAAHHFKAGHRVRLQVSGGAHPRFLRNYGTGEPPGRATRMVATDTTIQHSSVLTLPVVARGDS
ncbi:CocE/NonD family hydrolase [Actinoplanes sp. RD1]|uniref:CocE/NonD family hydrolase n=1 Tax=Actinoplanes sp. RD1 TaxID=3064538 RepID=UPI002741C88D|nr:CocE/NonD family hydrolase [Actinoplanes sp. RD1]